MSEIRVNTHTHTHILTAYSSRGNLLFFSQSDKRIYSRFADFLYIRLCIPNLLKPFSYGIR